MARHVLRRAAQAALALAAILLWPGRGDPVRAETIEAFTVRDVAVDRTAAAAAAAREAALVDGQRLALRRLFERLTPREDHGRLPNPGAARIAELVDSFEVQSERSSAVRYLATLTFRFKPDDVRSLLQVADIRFAETYAKPLLVLPVWRERGGLVALWDEPNPWRAAWARLPARDGLAPLIVPRGDLTDIAEISATQAATGEGSRITAISGRYGASGALVVEASLEPGDGRRILQVSVARFGAVGGDTTLVESVAASEAESDDTLMARTAVEIVRAVEERWKADSLLRFGHEEKLVAVVPLKTLGEWVTVRRRLAAIAAIRRSDLVVLERTGATVELVYIGDEHQLRLALAQRDLVLTREADAWRLVLTPAAARPPGP
ncbi:MAG: DUF2066 domain-containing protein [Pseudomonadota bacterium]